MISASTLHKRCQPYWPVHVFDIIRHIKNGKIMTTIVSWHGTSQVQNLTSTYCNWWTFLPLRDQFTMPLPPIPPSPCCPAVFFHLLQKACVGAANVHGFISWPVTLDPPGSNPSQSKTKPSTCHYVEWGEVEEVTFTLSHFADAFIQVSLIQSNLKGNKRMEVFPKNA